MELAAQYFMGRLWLIESAAVEKESNSLGKSWENFNSNKYPRAAIFLIIVDFVEVEIWLHDPYLVKTICA